MPEHGFLLENRQHDFLNDLFGRMFRAAALPSNREYKWPIALKEVVPSHRIRAAVQTLDQACPRVRVRDHRCVISVVTTIFALFRFVRNIMGDSILHRHFTNCQGKRDRFAGRRASSSSDDSGSVTWAIRPTIGEASPTLDMRWLSSGRQTRNRLSA